MSADRPGPMRSFEPRRVGELECDAWVAYYRREWWRFLRSAVGLVRATFRLPWPQTLWGAWLVLRANQLWAPHPDNDPERARACMRRFYALVARHHRERFDVERAARLEVEWWRVHRHLQQEAPEGGTEPLSAALAELYAEVYAVEPSAVLKAAEERAEAMVLSDRWVGEGCDLGSPLVPRERAALVRSYAALLAAVHRPA